MSEGSPVSSNARFRAVTYPLGHVRCVADRVVGADGIDIYRVTCADVASNVIMGRLFIPPQPQSGALEIVVEEVVDRVGGGYRHSSITLDLATREIARLDEKLARELRMRKRLWRRRRRVSSALRAVSDVVSPLSC
jgi:hypothetical protein